MRALSLYNPLRPSKTSTSHPFLPKPCSLLPYHLPCPSRWLSHSADVPVSALQGLYIAPWHRLDPAQLGMDSTIDFRSKPCRPPDDICLSNRWAININLGYRRVVPARRWTMKQGLHPEPLDLLQDLTGKGAIRGGFYSHRRIMYKVIPNRR